MKKLMLWTVSLTLSIATAHAQRDYGDLVEVDHFEIKSDKVSVKDYGKLASNYVITRTDKFEEFTYKASGVKTPKDNLFSKARDFKLVVERKDGAIKRISSISYENLEEGGRSSQSTALLSSTGLIESYTRCTQDYLIGRLGAKRKSQDTNCITISEGICSRFETEQIDRALVTDINNCSNLMNRMKEHQVNFEILSEENARSDLKALKKIDGRMSKVRHFYEIDSSSLYGLGQLANTYKDAIDLCHDLRNKKYLGTKTEVTVPAPIPVTSTKQ
jgi:hypothetical protein